MAAILLVQGSLLPLSVLGPQQEASSPRSIDFELQKEGGVLRIRSIYSRNNRIQAVAVAVQLAGTRERRQGFDLNILIDGQAKSRRKRFKAGEDIDFKARGITQPFKVLVSRVGKSSIEGKVVATSLDAITEVDLYSASGELRKDSPGIRLQPDSKESKVEGIHKGDSKVKNPALQRQTLPRYTEAAIKAETQGTLVLQIIVRKDGSVDSFKVLKSLGFVGLDERAIEEVANNWKFRPGTLDGEPVDVRATIEVTFSLESRK